MRSVLDIDMSFFVFEVCINFVRMLSENVPHLYFWHTAIGIQIKNADCAIFLARKTTTLLYTKVWKINVLFYEAARLYPTLKSSRKLDSVLQSRSIRVQGGHLCFQIGPTEKTKTKMCNRASTFCSTCFLSRTTRDHNSALNKEVVPKPE